MDKFQAENLQEMKLDVIELKRLLEFTNNARVKNILQGNIRTVEQEIDNLRAGTKEDCLANCDESKPSIKKRTYNVKLTTYAWDQTDTTVTIFLSLNGVHNLSKENIVCNFGTRLIDLVVKELDGKNYTFTINNLAEDIVTEKCSFKLKKDVVVLSLQKKTSENWLGLTSLEKEAKKKSNAKLTDTEDVDGDVDGAGGLMKIMQRIYEDGDDEMKRTISKAWSESMTNRSREF